MKKKIILSIAVLTLLTGCGKTIPKLENGQNAVVSFEDGSMISVDELYKEMKEDYATNILLDLIDKKLLEEEYKDKLDDAEEYAKSYVNSLKNYYVDDKGNYSESKLLQAVQNVGFKDIAAFQENVRMGHLKNLAVEDYVKSTLKDKELEDYYKKEIVGDREVLHIQIVPEVKDSMTDNEKKDKETEAENEAKAIIARLKKGEKFEDLAKELSDDSATKENGGSLGFINKGSYGSDVFDKEVYALKVGEYSTTPVKTSKGYEIVYIKSEKDKKAFDDVKEEIEKTLVNDKLDADATLQVTALVEFRKSKGVEIADSEIERDYKTYIDNSIAAIKAQNSSN